MNRTRDFVHQFRQVIMPQYAEGKCIVGPLPVITVQHFREAMKNLPVSKAKSLTALNNQVLPERGAAAIRTIREVDLCGLPSITS